jgi:hypothetical protein
VGKTFWVGNLKDQVYEKRQKEIYFFSPSSGNFSGMFRAGIGETPAMGMAFRVMEKELLSHGFLPRYANNDQLTDLTGEWIYDKRYPAGLVFSGLDGEVFSSLVKPLGAALKKLDEWAPVVLLDWFGNLRYRGEIKGARLFTRGNILTTSSRSLTYYLLNNKFRQVKFFIREKSPVWGFIGNSFPLFRTLWELRSLDPEFRVQYIIQPHPDSAKHREFLKKQTLIRQLFAHTFEVKDQANLNYAHQIVAEVVLTPDLKFNFKLEADQETAWVLSNDEDAAAAYTWAKENNITIPGQLSLVGLENDPRYYHLGLSYCGPDWDGIGYQLAHAVIGDIPVERTSSGFIRSKASVIEKLTTR